MNQFLVFRRARLSGLAALAGAAAFPVVARAQADSYFKRGDRVFPLARAGNWAAVQVKPNASGVLLRGLATDPAVDASRAALRFGARNVVVVPVKSRAAASQKRALLARLSASNAVASPVAAYTLGNSSGAPLIDVGDVAVRFKSGGDKSALLASLGARVVKKLGASSPDTFLVRAKAGASGVALANALAERGDVDFAEPDFAAPIAKYATTNDPLFPQQWHLANTGQGGGAVGADVRAREAWDVTRGSANVTIAVIDDGVDLKHEDFAGKLTAGIDTIDDDRDPSPVLPGRDGDHHGTACAGVAAAAGNNGVGVSGIAQGCRVMPIRSIGSFSTASDIAAGFDFAVANGAAVISNSWGYESAGFGMPVVIKAAIDNAVTRGRGGRGCVVVFASGNSGRSIDGDAAFNNVPDIAAYERVIAVGASDNFDKYISYSNTGKTLDLVAPSGATSAGQGTLDITTTDRTGTEGYSGTDYYGGFDGTSSSTPLVAGVAALLLSSEPNLTSDAVRQRLVDTADKVGPSDSYDSNGQSRLFGHGRVNAARALVGPPPKVTLVTPADNASLRGTVALAARTGNDSLVSRVDFSARRLFFAGGVPSANIAIPDSNAAGIKSTLAVGLGAPRRFASTTATVRVRIEHTYPQDLQVALVHLNAAGQSVREVIFDHAEVGGEVLNLEVPLPLASRAVAGSSYTLQVIDDVADDEGRLVSWGLTLGSTFSAIGSQAAVSHVAGADWSVPWNTDAVITGTYEVRATSVSARAGSFADTNGNIAVAGRSEGVYSISGRVADSRGVGVAGAIVTNATANNAARTDASGNFRLPTVPTGTYTLRVALKGAVFTPAERRVAVGTANVTGADFTLSQRDAIAPALVVTAPAASGAVLTSLPQARGTATDIGGTGVASVVGVLYRAPQAGSTLPSGYYTRQSTFVATPTIDAERPATLSGSTFALALPQLEGAYRLDLRATDRAGNVTLRRVLFTIDRTLPSLLIAAPTASVAVRANAAFAATGTSADAVGVASVSARLFRPSGIGIAAGYYSPVARDFVATASAATEIAAAGTTSWRVVLPSLAPGRYALRVRVVDRAGNARESTVIVTVDASSINGV